MPDSTFARKYDTFATLPAAEKPQPIRTARMASVEAIIADPKLVAPKRQTYEFKTSTEARFKSSPMLPERPKLRETTATERIEVYKARTVEQQDFDPAYFRNEAGRTHFYFYDEVDQQDYYRPYRKFYYYQFDVFKPRAVKPKRQEPLEAQNRLDYRFYTGEKAEHPRKRLNFEPPEEKVNLYYSHSEVVYPRVCETDFTRKLGGGNYRRAVPETPVKKQRICLKYEHDKKLDYQDKLLGTSRSVVE